MTALLLLALLAAPSAPAPTPAARFQAANQAYLAGDFAAATRAYQELLADGWESPSLHVNLGNARFRMGKRGLAAASYARALRLDPGDADARSNLDLVRSLNVDQVLGAEAQPLVIRALDRVPDGLAIAAFALAWLGLWGGLAGRRFVPAGAVRGLTAGAFAAALVAVGSGAVLAGKAAARGTPTAFIVASTAPVREGAEAALRPAFQVHEGTEVRVLEVRAGFVRVRLGNGLEGWVSAGDLEPV